MNRRPEPSIIAPGASAEEAAAVVAALERFLRDTTPVAAPEPGGAARVSPWTEAALREGVGRAPERLPPWS
jgi:hypothetical protein